MGEEKAGSRWDSKDPWQYREEESSYGWLKRLLASVLIFALVYGAQVSDTVLGRTVIDGVRYVLTAETDFTYLVDKLNEFSPKNMDVSVLKRVQNTMLKPADPAHVYDKALLTENWYRHLVGRLIQCPSRR